MKYKTTTIEVKTTINPKNRSSSCAPGILKEYKTIDIGGKTIRVPVSRIIHNDSFIVYQEYATRRYEIDLDRIYRDKEVTVQIRVKSPIVPKWIPFTSLIERFFTSYDLVPYWTGNCYAQLTTKIVYTKEQFERGERLSKEIGFGPDDTSYAGCDASYPGICIAECGLCSDFTTGSIHKESIEQAIIRILHREHKND